MGASTFEYRHRYALHALLFVLAFAAPWNYWLHLDPSGPNAHVWGLLAVWLVRMGIPGIAVAFNLLLILAIVCAAFGAGLRTWGTAYLGGSVVESASLHTAGSATVSGVVEAGPYRFVRNPLYLGTILHTLALTLLMPPSGAVFAIFTICIFQIHLIFSEEKFLEARLGEPYKTYCGLVPRLLPALSPRIASQPLLPDWGHAVLTEIYMWGVAVAFMVAGWRYSAVLLMQCVLVSFGVALVSRAVRPLRSSPSNSR